MIRRFGRRVRRVWRELRLRDAVGFTLPVVGCLAYVLVASGFDYRRTHQFDDWWSSGRSVASIFRARIDAVLHAPAAATLRLQLDPESEDPGVIRLIVDPAAWAAVQADPLVGWGVWSEAVLVRGGERVSVDVRKRGDTSVHYTTERTSFSLRMPRTSLFAGSREIGVTGKTVLVSWFANILPAEFGALAPRTAMAPVFVNDRFYGMFRLAETVDESFLRNADRMPGMVFRADAAERGEVLKGSERNVFRNPQAWQRPAEGAMTPGVPADSGLLGMLAALTGGTFANHVELMSRVDRSQLAAVLAAAMVAGDPYHMSGVHNQHWYEDPTDGLLYLIPWDLRQLRLDANDGRINPFFAEAFRNPFVVDEVQRRLAGQLAGDSLYRRAERLITEGWNRWEPHFRYELLRRGAISDPGTPAEVLSLLRHNLDVIRDRLADTRIRVATGVANGTGIIDLETAGWSAGVLSELRLAGPVGRVRLLADRDADGRPGDADLDVPVRIERDSDGTRIILDEPLTLYSTWYAPEQGFQPGRTHYRLFLIGDVPASLADMKPVVRNAYTAAPAELLAWSDSVNAAAHGWNAWRYPLANPRRHVLRGTIVLDEDLYIPAGDTLYIEPGTTLRMAPGVSLESRGRVIARGTAAAPIRVLPAQPGNPWGVFALQGDGADHSTFEHVTFAEGSSARVNRVGYKGMVDVHHADSVVFRRVRFERNLKSDDAINAVYATAYIVDSEFIEANSDAIDFDHSAGEIRNTRFVGAGGDAIDLMTSAPRIVGNVMEGSGDKGISVGEASSPIIVDNLITGSSRGIEVKDRSRPFVVHNVITGNDVGISQKVKNWRYGAGGWGTLIYSTVDRNGIDIDVDDRSPLTVLASRIGPLNELLAGGTLDSVPAAIASSRTPIASAEPAWLYPSLGLPTGGATPGRLDTPLSIAPVAPMHRLTFHETLGGDLFGWSVLDGTAHLAVRRTELVAEFEGRRGVIGRSLDWTLPDDGRRYQAVLEVGGTGLADVRVQFLDGDAVRGETIMSIPEIPGGRWLVTLDLPAGRITGLRLEAAPRPDAQRVNPETGLLEVRTGRLRLGGIQVHGWRAEAD